MNAAKRHHKLVTHLTPKGTWFGIAQVMCIGRRSPAYEARLGGDILQMFLVAPTPRLERGGFLDWARSAAAAGSAFSPWLAAEAGSLASPVPTAAILASNARSSAPASSGVNVFLVGRVRCAQASASSEELAGTSSASS